MWVGPSIILLFCLFGSWYWYDTNDLVLVLQYGFGMDPLLSYYSVYLGLGIGMILMMTILCCYCNMNVGWILYYLIILFI